MLRQRLAKRSGGLWAFIVAGVDEQGPWEPADDMVEAVFELLSGAVVRSMPSQRSNHERVAGEQVSSDHDANRTHRMARRVEHGRGRVSQRNFVGVGHSGNASGELHTEDVHITFVHQNLGPGRRREFDKAVGVVVMSVGHDGLSDAEVVILCGG